MVGDDFSPMICFRTVGVMEMFEKGLAVSQMGFPVLASKAYSMEFSCFRLSRSRNTVPSWTMGEPYQAFMGGRVQA